MLSSNYRGILIVAVISISWCKAATLVERDIVEDKVFQSNDVEEALEPEYQCPPNEMPNKSKMPELYCDAELVSDFNYYVSDVGPKCRCAIGYRRLSNGKCGTEKECISDLNCPPDELPNLDQTWQLTCNDDDNETSMPVQKCLCPPGKVRKWDGSCVLRSMCGVSFRFY